MLMQTITIVGTITTIITNPLTKKITKYIGNKYNIYIKNNINYKDYTTEEILVDKINKTISSSNYDDYDNLKTSQITKMYKS
jgi:hypothetical protein